MALTPVTDPDLLKQLNSDGAAPPPDLTPVTDPDLLKQLNYDGAAPPPDLTPVADPAILAQLEPDNEDYTRARNANLRNDLFRVLTRNERLTAPSLRAFSDPQASAAGQLVKGSLEGVGDKLATGFEMTLDAVGLREGNFERGALNDILTYDDLYEAGRIKALPTAKGFSPLSGVVAQDAPEPSSFETVAASERRRIVKDELIPLFDEAGVEDGKKMMAILRDSVAANEWDSTSDQTVRRLTDGSLSFNPDLVMLPNEEEGLKAIREARSVPDNEKDEAEQRFRAARAFAAKKMDEKTREYEPDYAAHAERLEAAGITDPEEIFFSWPKLDRNWVESSWDFIRDTVAESGRNIYNTVIRAPAMGLAQATGFEGDAASVGRRMSDSQKKSQFVREIAAARGQTGGPRETMQTTGTTVLDMVPMFTGAAGGRMLARTGKEILGKVVAGGSVYAYSGMQGYASIMQTAVQETEAKANALNRSATDEELNSAIENAQGAAILNGVQTLFLTAVLNKGTESAAIQGLTQRAGVLTGRDLMGLARKEFGKNGLRAAYVSVKPEVKKFVGQTLKAAGESATDELVEEYSNQLVEGLITKYSGIQGDKTLSEIGWDAAKGGGLGLGIGGGLPAFLRTFGRPDVEARQAMDLVTSAEQQGAGQSGEAALEVSVNSETNVLPTDETSDPPETAGETPVSPEVSVSPISETVAVDETAPDTQQTPPTDEAGQVTPETAQAAPEAAAAVADTGGEVGRIGGDEKGRNDELVAGRREGARPGEQEPQGAETPQSPQEGAEGLARGAGRLPAGVAEQPTGSGEVLGELGVAGRGDGRAGGGDGQASVGDVADADPREIRKEVKKEAREKAKIRWRDILSSGSGVLPYRATGGQYVITPSSKPGVMFQITRTNADGEPVGDEEIRTKEDYRRVLNDDEYLEAALLDVRPDVAQASEMDLAIPEFNKDYLFKYRLKYRDVGPATAPKGFVSAEGRDVTYDRPLTEQELYDFEIEPVGATEKTPTPTTTEATLPEQNQSTQAPSPTTPTDTLPEGTPVPEKGSAAEGVMRFTQADEFENNVIANVAFSDAAPDGTEVQQKETGSLKKKSRGQWRMSGSGEKTSPPDVGDYVLRVGFGNVVDLEAEKQQAALSDLVNRSELISEFIDELQEDGTLSESEAKYLLEVAVTDPLTAANRTMEILQVKSKVERMPVNLRVLPDIQPPTTPTPQSDEVQRQRQRRQTPPEGRQEEELLEPAATEAPSPTGEGAMLSLAEVNDSIQEVSPVKASRTTGETAQVLTDAGYTLIGNVYTPPLAKLKVSGLSAVNDNTATEEQVASLVEQGLVEQISGQNVITESGIKAMTDAGLDAPKLTPDERRAEIRKQTPVTEYSVEGLKQTFDLTDEQATVADAIGKALGAQIGGLAKGGKPGDGALRQGPKGAMEVTETGKILLRGLQSPDFSTAVHELAHAARRTMDALLTPEEVKTISEWAGTKNGKWDRAAEEKYARGWERYFTDGKAPLQKLQGIFDKIAEWMRDVYRNIQDSPIDVEITPEVRAIFDKMASRLDLGAATDGQTGAETDGQTGAETEEAEPKTMGIKRAKINEALSELGLPTIDPIKFDSTEAELARAFEELERDPEAAENLARRTAAEYAKDKRDVKGYTAKEWLMVNIHKARLQLAQAKTDETWLKTRRAGDQVRANELWQKSNEQKEHIREFSTHVAMAGSASGYAFRAMQNVLDDSLTLAGMVRDYETRILGKGETISEEALAKIAEAANKLKQERDTINMETLAKELEKEGKTAEAQMIMDVVNVIESLKEELADARRKIAAPKRREIKRKLRISAEQARKRLEARGWFGGEDAPDVLFQDDTSDPLSGLSPKLARDLKDMSVYFGSKFADKLLDGTLTFEVFAKTFVEEMGKAARPYSERVYKLLQQVGANETVDDAPLDPDSILDGVDPDAPDISRSVVYDLLKAHVAEGEAGLTAMDSVLADVKRRFPDLEVTRDDLFQTLTNYGKTRSLSQEPTDVEIRRIRNLAREALKQADIAAGRLPKLTGLTPDPTDPEVRQARKKTQEDLRELEEKMRARGEEIPSDERRQKTVLQTMKRRMENELAELEEAVNSGKPIVRVTRGGVAMDAEAAEIRAKVEQARKDYRDAFPPAEATFEQKVAAADKLLDKQIEREKQLIKAGVSETPTTNRISTPDLEAKREYLARLRQERRELNPENTPLGQAKKARREANERLKSILESNDLKVRRKEPIDADEELLALIEEGDALRAEIRERRKVLPETDSDFRQREARELKQAEARLKELENILETGEVPIRNNKKKPQSAAVQRVRNRIRELNKKVGQMRREQTPEVEKARRYAAMLDKKTADLQRRVREKDSSPLRKKTKPNNHPVAEAARRRYQKAADEYNAFIGEEAYKKQSLLLKLLMAPIDLAFAGPKAVMASADASGFGKQGLKALVAHPKKTLAAYPKNFYYAEEAAANELAGIRTRENYHLYKKMHLQLKDSTQGAKNIDVQEAYQSRIASRIPILGRIVKFSERGYVSFTNRVMADIADLLLEPLKQTPGGLNENNLRMIGDHVNRLVGSASFKGFERVGPVLGYFLWAPKFLFSQLDTLRGVGYSTIDVMTGFKAGDAIDTMLKRNNTKAARKLIAIDNARLAVGYASLYGALGLAVMLYNALRDEDQPEAKLGGMNPQDSDFGKVVVGDTRYDFGGGMLQFAVFGARLLSGKIKKSDGQIEDISDAAKSPFDQTRLSLIGRFAQSKLGPSQGTFVNMLQSESFMGGPFYWEEEMVGNYIPLPFQEFYEAYRQGGMDHATVRTLLSFHGFTSNRYGEETKSIYDSNIARDINKTALYPLFNALAAPFGKRVHPYRTELDPDEYDAIIDR